MSFKEWEFQDDRDESEEELRDQEECAHNVVEFFKSKAAAGQEPTMKEIGEEIAYNRLKMRDDGPFNAYFRQRAAKRIAEADYAASSDSEPKSRMRRFGNWITRKRKGPDYEGVYRSLGHQPIANYLTKAENREVGTAYTQTRFREIERIGEWVKKGSEC